MTTEQIVLASIPNGMPTPAKFSFKDYDLPDLQAGKVFLKGLYFSVDPFMRGGMNKMKVILVLFFIILITKIAQSQEEKSPTVKFLTKRGYIFKDSTTINSRAKSLQKWPDTLYYSTSYRATLLGSSTLPFSFTKTVLINGKFVVVPTISIGYGYTWFVGEFIFNENDKITVDPVFFFGLMADIGIQNDFSLNKFTSIFTGVFVGFGAFTLFGGYDYMSHSPSIGLGARIDFYTIFQTSLRPFGKVREVRKHRRAAIPITNE